MFTFLIRLIQSIINFFRGVAPTPPVVTINVLPVITLLRPTSDVTGDKVVIEYKLSDDESDPADLNVSFSIARGPSQVATADTQDSRHSGVSGLATNPGGITYHFIWDWKQDITQDPVDDVSITMKALGPSGQGNSVLSNPLRLSTSSTVNHPPVVDIQSPTSDVYANEVLVEYLLSDIESDPSDIVVHYQIAGDIPQLATPKNQDPRHSGISGLATDPAGISYAFVWDWQVDLVQASVNNVQVLIQAHDAFGAGLQKTSIIFNLTVPGGTISVPKVEISSLASPVNAPVLIDYTITDPASGIYSSEVKYSLNNGANFHTARPHANSNATTGLNSSPQGSAHSFLWDADANLSSATQDVIIRVLCTSGAISIEDRSTPFDFVTNHSPMVDVWNPSGGLYASPVTVDYVLTDLESDTISIIPEYKVPGGNFEVATRDSIGRGSGTSGLISSDSGVGHSFIWNATRDLGSQGASGVVFKITANDGFTDGEDVSAPFDVGLSQPNIIIDSPRGGARGAPVPVIFQVSDPTQNQVQGEISFSTDQGNRFTTANPAPGRGSEDLSTLSASHVPVSHFFAWDASADLSGTPTPHNDIILKVRISSPSGTVEANSVPFDVRYTISGAPQLPPITPSTSIPQIHKLWVASGIHKQSQVPLHFTIQDADMKPTSMLVEYKPQGGGFQAATASTISDSPVGMAAPDIIFDHRFVWDAEADMGIMANPENVDIRMTPYVGPIKGQSETRTVRVHVEQRPTLPPLQTVADMTNSELTIIDGDAQTGAGGFLLPRTLQVRVKGPDGFGNIVELEGVRVSFKVVSSIPNIELEEDNNFSIITRYDGMAGIRVRTPEVNSSHGFEVVATLVGVQNISKTFNLTVDRAVIETDNNIPADVDIDHIYGFNFYIGAEAVPNSTRHIKPERDNPVRFRVRATNAVIVNDELRIPPDVTRPTEVTSNYVTFSPTVPSTLPVPATPASDVVLTIDIPSMPTIAPKLIRIPVRRVATARRLTSYSATRSYENVYLKFELADPVTTPAVPATPTTPAIAATTTTYGYDANGKPQRAFSGMMLEKPFKVKISDENGDARYRKQTTQPVSNRCDVAPPEDDLVLHWSGQGLEFSLTAGGPTTPDINAKITEQVFVKIVWGWQRWEVQVNVVSPHLLLDPNTNTFGTPGISTLWCHRDYVFEGLQSYSRPWVGGGRFFIESANIDLYDVSTNDVVENIHPGMRVEVRLNNFSPYTTTATPNSVQLQLVQPDGRQPMAQQGINGKWTDIYTFTAHSPMEFRSQTIWIAQGDSRTPAATTDKIHAVIPLASLVGTQNGANFSKPTQGRRRHRRLVGDSETIQDSPSGSSLSAGADGSVFPHSGEYIQSFCDLQFSTRNDSLSVCRTYRSQVVSENPDFEPLGPGWFLDLDSFITVGRFPSLWSSGRSDDLFFSHHIISRIRPVGLFFDLETNSTIDPDNSAFQTKEVDGLKTHFNADGSVRFIESTSGDRTHFVYDEKGRLERIKDFLDPTNRWIEFEYSTSATAPSNGRLIKIKDFYLREIVYEYYGAGDPKGGEGWLKKVTKPSCLTMRGGVTPVQFQRSETFEYEPDSTLGWRLKSILNSDNEIQLINHYDNQGRIVRQEPKRDASDQRDFLFQYPATSETLIKDPKRNEIKYKFPASPYWDSACAKEIIEDPSGLNISTKMLHSHHGLILESQSPMLEKTQFIYSRNNYGRSASNILAIITKPQPGTRTTPAPDRIATFSYELDFNNITAVVPPEGNHPDSEPAIYKTEFEYNATGELIRSISPRSINAYRKTNGDLRWLPESPDTELEYNAFHQVKKQTDPIGVVTTYFYYPEDDPGGLGGGTPIEDGAGFLAIVDVDTEVTSKRDTRLGSVPLKKRSTQYFYNPVGDIVKVIENLRTSGEKTTEYSVNELHEVNRITTGLGLTNPIVSNHYYNAEHLLAQNELEQTGSNNIAGGDKLIEKFSYNFQGQLKEQQTRIWDSVNNQFKWIKTNLVLHDDDRIHYVEPPFNAAFPDLKEKREYDSRGILKSVTKGTQITHYEPTPNGDLKEIVQPSGDTTTFEFDRFSTQEASIDGRGNITGVEKNPSGRVVRTLVQDGHEHNPGRVYSTGQLPSIQLIEQKYNENGIARRTHYLQSYLPSALFLSPTTSTPVNPVSDFLAPDLTPLPAMIAHQEDGKARQGDGRSVSDTLTNALGQKSRLANDEAGYEIFGYSPHSELTDIQTITGNDSSLTYDDTGNLVEYEEKTAYRDASGTIIRRSFFTKFDYDEHDRVKRTVDNEGNATRMAYDQTGFVEKTWDSMGQDTGEMFHGNPVNGPGNLRTFHRDALGRTVKVESFLTANGMGGGVPESTAYNQLGKTIHEFEYHADGGPFKAFIDHEKYYTDTDYRADGLVEKIHHWLAPGGRTGTPHTTENVYVTNTALIDHKIDSNGSKTQLRYHALHKEVIESIETIIPSTVGSNIRLDGATKYEFKYDGYGNIELIKDLNSGYQTGALWDNAGRLVSEKQGQYILKSSYIGDRQRQLTYPGSTLSVDYKHDRLGRLMGIDDRGQNLANFYYRGNGRLRKRKYGNIDIVFEHDDAGQLNDMQVQIQSASIHFVVERDRMGRVKTLSRTSGSITEASTWRYDSVGRVVNESFVSASGATPLVTRRYFDGDDVLRKEEQDVLQGTSIVQNVIEQDRAYMGQISNRNGVSFGYDNIGNLTDDGSQQYVYDPLNRLVRIEDSGQTTCSYVYDGQNRLTQRTAGTDVEEYVYDGWQLIEVRDGINGPVKERFVYSTEIDDLISIEIGDRVFRVIMSPIGNVDSLINANDQLIESYRYDLNGRVTVLDRNRQVLSTPPISRLLFMGRVYDLISKLYQYRMRWYHPEFGSFITPDPLGFTSGPNYYLLCTGDPVNRTDPTGLSDLEFRALIRIVKAHPTDLAAKRALLTKVLSWGSRAAQAALVAEGMSLNALRAEVAGFRSTAQISSELSAAFRARGVLTVAEAEAATALAAETAVTAESAEVVALTAEALEAAAVTAESAETGALVTEVIVKKGTERAALGGAAGFLGRAGCLAAASTVLEIAGSAYLGYEVGDYLFNKRRIRERKILAEFAEAEALHQRMFAAEYARERRLKLWSDAKQSCTAGAYYLNQAARAEKDRKMFGGSDVSNQDPSVLESFFSTKNEKATSVGSRERQENEYGERFVGPLRPGKRRSGIFSKK